MEQRLSPEERQWLLRVARDAIVSSVTDGSLPPPETSTGKLLEQRGCFVTIKKPGELRGCIGNFISDKPLCELVQEMAVSAATRDPRFYPMKKTDLIDFELEISVLSSLQKIETVEDIRVGEHGLYLEKNFSRGVLLPQVAVEYGWDRETFLRQACVKAGLRPEDWQEGTDIYIFSAEVFGEK